MIPLRRRCAAAPPQSLAGPGPGQQDGLGDGDPGQPAAAQGPGGLAAIKRRLGDGLGVAGITSELPDPSWVILCDFFRDLGPEMVADAICRFLRLEPDGPFRRRAQREIWKLLEEPIVEAILAVMEEREKCKYSTPAREPGN